MQVLNEALGGQSGQQGFQGAALVQEIAPALFAKRSFRAYREFTGAQSLKFVAAKPFLLTYQGLYVDAGAAKCRILQGATEGGTFTAILTKFCKNLLDGPVAGNTTISAGGTLTGGTEREVLRASSGAGVGILNTIGAPRLLPAGTYQMDITVTGTTSGVYVLEWDELP